MLISETDKFKVIRPILGQETEDLYNMPSIKKDNYSSIDFEELKIVDAQKIKEDSNNSLALMFNADKVLDRYWNNPLKYLAKFQLCKAVSTPDFSVYPGMHIMEIQHNVFKNRWLGVTWQNAGNIVLPTIQWGTKETYDICFSGVEEGCIVVISTLGCQHKKEEFLEGFFEMKKRIKPPLIIVFGDMIEGMTGRFINFKYEDIFTQKELQLKLKEFRQVFEREEVMSNGK